MISAINFIILVTILILIVCSGSDVISSNNVVYIGGMFTTFNVNDKLINNGENELAAVLLAIRDINSSPYLLPNTTVKLVVKGTRYDKLETVKQTLEMTKSAFNEVGVTAIIGPWSYLEMVSSVAVTKYFKIPHISYSTSATDFSNRLSYPYMTSVLPSDSYQGIAIARLVNSYGWKHIVTIQSDDDGDIDGIGLFQQFRNAASSLDIKIVADIRLHFPVTQAAIEALKLLNVNIYIILTNSNEAGEFIMKGSTYGLITDNIQLIGSDRIDSGMWNRLPISNNFISALKGMLTISSTISFSTLEGQSFMNRYRTLRNSIISNQNCLNETDDVGNYLWKQKMENGDYLCTGVNFTSYYADGSNLQPHIPYAYDAVMVIAKALHIILYDLKQTSVDGDLLYKAICQNVSFQGVTGPINFTRTLRVNSGERQVGIRYSIMVCSNLPCIMSFVTGLMKYLCLI